jgi:hypothetical protein
MIMPQLGRTSGRGPGRATDPMVIALVFGGGSAYAGYDGVSCSSFEFLVQRYQS